MNLSAPAVLDANAKVNQFLKRLALVVAVLFLLLNAVTAISVLRISLRDADTSEMAAMQSADNARVLQVILAVTGCQANDTPEQCSRRYREGAMAEGARRVAEVDCADRRRVAGLPAPTPGIPCPEQTPAEVYPGTTTERNP